MLRRTRKETASRKQSDRRAASAMLRTGSTAKGALLALRPGWLASARLLRRIGEAERSSRIRRVALFDPATGFAFGQTQEHGFALAEVARAPDQLPIRFLH